MNDELELQKPYPYHAVFGAPAVMETCGTECCESADVYDAKSSWGEVNCAPETTYVDPYLYERVFSSIIKYRRNMPMLEAIDTAKKVVAEIRAL